MKKIILTFLSCCLLLTCFSQAQRKLSLYLSGQYTKTLYDRTILNNPWGAGIGASLFLNNPSKFKPTIDLTADAYLVSVNILYVDSNDQPLDGINGMVNLFAGVSYHPTRMVYLSLVGGPGFINGEAFFGIKPSLGCYFSKTQKLTAKVYYINIFNRMKNTKEDFGGIGLSVGVKLF